MKTKKIITIIVLMSLTMGSCREITVKTKVNSDGSFTRMVSLVGDSLDVIKMDLPYPIDESWMRQLEKDTADSARFICTYSKTFDDDKDLNVMLTEDTSWRKQIGREVEVSKRFMFFYSFITYREKYKKADPSNLLNYKDYLNPEDIEWVTGYRLPITNKDSIRNDSAQARAERYVFEALIAEVMHALNKGLQKLPDPELNEIDLLMYSDSIKKYTTDWADNDLVKFIDALASWVGNEKIRDLHKLSPPIFEELSGKIKFFEHILMMEDFRIEVEMPGLITGTNSNELIGNSVGWNIKSLTFYFDDYEMYVESRVVNRWAFVLSGVVLLLLLVVFIVRIFK